MYFPFLVLRARGTVWMRPLLGWSLKLKGQHADEVRKSQVSAKSTVRMLVVVYVVCNCDGGYNARMSKWRLEVVKPDNSFAVMVRPIYNADILRPITNFLTLDLLAHCRYI